jgi:RimJ/RimL family protein N-acetyltransferase
MPTPARRPLSLRPLNTPAASQIEHWFDHPEVQQRLGGRFWIHRELRLIDERPGTTFRGMRVLRSLGWVAVDATQAPVAFIGGAVYDRWVRYHGEGPHGAVISDEINARAMSLAYVVDPARWRQGYGRAALAAVLEHPDLADVELFICGIDGDNVASQRCATAAGLHLIDTQPDHEGMLYFHLRRQAINPE